MRCGEEVVDRGWWWWLRAGVAERQTRYVQGVVSARAWEFKSPPRHLTEELGAFPLRKAR
jgi:hypothetical protein